MFNAITENYSELLIIVLKFVRFCDERSGKKLEVVLGDIDLELPAVNLELCSEMIGFGRGLHQGSKGERWGSLASNLESNR